MLPFDITPHPPSPEPCSKWAQVRGKARRVAASMSISWPGSQASSLLVSTTWTGSCVLRDMNFSLEFHLFLNLGSCFLDRQGRSQASEGLISGLPLLSAHSCSAVKIHHSHFLCPRLPLNGHVRTLPQGCYLALENSVFIVSGTGRL